MLKQMIIEMLPNLTYEDLSELSDLFSNQLIHHEIHQISQDITEQRYVSGRLECPFCKNSHVVKNGIRQQTQRYLCRSCHKSFCTQTLTASAYSKKSSSVWMKYIECLFNGFSLRKCAEICEINLTTAFYWRHKLLESFKSHLSIGHVSGLIEADECFFRFNQKGQRGTKKFTSKKRGISNQQVAVGTALDRQGNLILGILGRGPMKYELCINVI